MSSQNPRSANTAVSDPKELIVIRAFSAPKNLVWKAWTDPKQVVKWWGPKDYTSPACVIDLRVGGKYQFCMRSPQGKYFWSTGVYREIVEKERIVYTDSFADEKGNIVPATHYDLSPDIPLEMTVTVTFDEHDNTTSMILKHADLPSGTMSELTGQGWNESFDKLAESLKQNR